jgi:putative restriction endonuclease
LRGEESPADEGVLVERSRRSAIWARLVGAGGPSAVEPRLLRELGIYGGAPGFLGGQGANKAVAPGTGAAVGLLHTGSAYADDLADGGVVYHYPSTNRRGKDRAEIAAVKAAGELRLPVSVIIYSGLRGRWRRQAGRSGRSTKGKLLRRCHRPVL